VGLDLVFEFVAGVVGAQGDFHAVILRILLLRARQRTKNKAGVWPALGETTSSTSLLLVVVMVVVVIFVFVFVIVSKFHSHFSVLDRLVSGLDGCGAVSTFIGFGLLQVFASFPQGL
jgi:hypothetical protein